MVFSSFYFLLYFLPLFFISYVFVENKYKNLILLLYSIGFYAFGCMDNLYYVLILLMSLVINYFIAIGIENYDIYDAAHIVRGDVGADIIRPSVSDNAAHTVRGDVGADIIRPSVSDNAAHIVRGDVGARTARPYEDRSNPPLQNRLHSEEKNIRSRSKTSYDIRHHKNKFKNIRTALLVLALVLNFGNLFIFKYYNFFTDIINIINKNISLNKTNLILPIGISFYTFQIVSYVIDVYFKKIKAERNFIDFATYVIMFPQLIAGPIVRFINVQKEIKSDRSIILKNIYDGLSIFIIGLASKVIVANQLSLVKVDISDVGYDRLCALAAWFGAASYSMQMYFDFFGYSLMAIGLGKMIGITIPDNFKDPFLSTSVEEYWRRWHITLSTWFRDYLMYPILLSKPVKNIRSVLNKLNKKFASFITTFIAMFIVWAATGLWHGANYNYVMWGIYFFIFMVLEQLILSKTILKIKPLAHIYLIVVIVISFVIFSNENLEEMMLYFSKMFGSNTVFLNETFEATILNNLRSIIIGILCVLKLPNMLYSYINKKVALNTLVMAILLGISLFLIYLGYNDPFLYFRF